MTSAALVADQDGCIQACQALREALLRIIGKVKPDTEDVHFALISIDQEGFY